MALHSSLLFLEQVLEDQRPPAISASLHKQSTFGKAAKSDRREA